MDTAYIFSTEEKARRFRNAADKMGLEVKRIGNAVIAHAHTLATVCDHYQVYPDDMPVWTNSTVPAMHVGHSIPSGVGAV